MLPPTNAGLETNRRILIVDDNEAIHADFRKILGPVASDAGLVAAESAIFGSEATEKRAERASFEIDFAFQGEEALDRVRAACKAGRRYTMAFMDVRMPPGWDGIETTVKLWEVDPDLQVVLCTAYSDYSWDEMMAKIGNPERLLILKKPFDPIEVLQFAHALTEKWSLLQAARCNLDELERAVDDRTEELQTANALLELEISGHRASAERVREQAALLEKARDAIIVRDLNDTILFWNTGAEIMYGWNAEEALGRVMLDLLFERPDDFHVAKAVVVEKDSWQGEMAQKTRDGRTVNVDCSWTLVRDSYGQPKSILSIHTDVTEKKEFEAQFARAQRMEGIGALASGIAHDMNDLLAPIVLAIELLQSHSNGGKEDEELLSIMSSSANRAVNMVKQVLFFSKKVEPSRVEIQPWRLIRDLEQIVSDTFTKSIRIRTAAPGDAWTIQADPTQIHQALLNLCFNARDSMPEGGTIDLSAENVQIDADAAASIWGLSPGPHVLIKVADTGTGIAPEHLDKIFEPFFTTKEFGKGTGLGLSTVFGIVKNHSGAITVRSEVGTGTTFSVYLPAPAPDDASSESLPPPAPPRGQGELILVVDDETSILSVTRHCLEAGGYRVLTAGDGVEAVALVAQHQGRFAAVLTDMMMPVLNGVATIRVLKKMAPKLPIIATSGGGDRSYEAEALAAGAMQFIHKPYTSERLLQTIHQVITK